MNNSELYLHCQVSRALLLAEAPAPLHNIRLLTLEGEEVPAPVLSCEELEEGLWRTRIDASQLYCWSPETPVLYRFVSDEVEQRFGYCEIRRFHNKAVLFNGSPIYFRGIIRGIAAHDHPNMTGGTLFDAAVKYIRQAKKYGFNLVRFHSTIPWPEFVDAADQEGILIHAEIGFAYDRNEKGEKVGLAMDQTTWKETLRKYRNSPSMAIFCIGNEMHNSGRVPQVHAIYQEGRRLAPGKLIIDNSGWGEYDRTSADIFSQHVAYFFPFGNHKEMFHVEDPWLINGSTYQVPFDTESLTEHCSAKAHRAVTPIRPTLAHEAVHYIDVPDYYALREKFDAFCQKVGPEYLAANEIARPKFLDALPQLIERKGLLPRFPKMVAASRHFRQACLKQYLESCRFSSLCGFEMLQFADCLKYENKNGIVDCFDDDKDIDPQWMRQFNGQAALLLQVEKPAFYWTEGLKATIHVSDFLPEPELLGTLTVTLAFPDGKTETLYQGEKFTLVGGLQKLAEVEVAFPEGPAQTLQMEAVFAGEEGTLFRNAWTLWGFPKPQMPPVPENTLVTGSFNEEVFQALEKGMTVLLTLPKPPAKGQADFFFPGAREHCKPCIWDRGSNLGGVIESPAIREALGGQEFFNLRLFSLFHDAFKVNLDTFPGKVTEWMWGVDKPVRDRMKGLVQGVKHFIDADTLRNFSHLFSVRVGAGALVVCTLNLSLDAPAEDCVIRNFSAALLKALPQLAQTDCSIAPEALKDYLREVQKKGPSKEDTMNHFWEIDNKLVEDTLFWEEANLDLRKID